MQIITSIGNDKLTKAGEVLFEARAGGTVLKAITIVESKEYEREILILLLNDIFPLGCMYRHNFHMWIDQLNSLEREKVEESVKPFLIPFITSGIGENLLKIIYLSLVYVVKREFSEEELAEIPSWEKHEQFSEKISTYHDFSPTDVLDNLENIYRLINKNFMKYEEEEENGE